MKLFSFKTKEQMVRIGIELDGQKYDFTRIWDMFKDIQGRHRFPDLTFMQVMIELGLFNVEDINEVISTVKNLRSLDDLTIKAPIKYDVPIARPQKIICLGRNYRKHAEEFNKPVPKEPIIFAKLPSTLIAHESTIVLPRNVGRVDHEGELALVISKTAKNIAASKAYEYIAGYTIMNDVTARAMQIQDIENKLPWTRTKGFDTFGPMGPFLIPHKAIFNPHQLDIIVKLNGEIRQHANTSEMIFKIPELIQYISRYMTLSPGDIIATGTPEGVSELHDGDVVSVAIDQIGILENNVVAE